MRVARRYVITGRVQGVGFRYFTQDAALREGVTGWVRNLPDGRVEALVDPALDELEPRSRDRSRQPVLDRDRRKVLNQRLPSC